MSYAILRRFRRLSQIAFLLLFLLLLVRTELRGSIHTAGDMQLPYALRIFLQADPLTAFANVLSTGALYRGLLWSLVIIVPTLFLGRFFCGWICPLGTINHFLSNLRSDSKRGRRRIESNRYQRWQTWKYYLLLVLLVGALFGGEVLGIFDPISLTVRSLAVSILPAVNYALNAVLNWFSRSPTTVLRSAADALSLLLKATVLSFRQPYFRQSFVPGAIFIAILALNLRTTRFWCRALCPLGALLGLLSRWSILGLEKSSGKCGDCNRCVLHCQGGDDPIPKSDWRKAECHLCFNCVTECPEDSIRFRFFPGRQGVIEKANLQRRKVLTSVGTGMALLPLLRSTTGLATERHERLIRPPGALDENAFLARCIRCGECMKVCPNNALHPTLTQAGLEGIWTPVLVPRIGYCEPSCVLCCQVCPTGAIWEITPREKAWATAADPNAKPIRVGTAFYDRGRCLPWAMATECIVCEEWCPTSPKAVYLRQAEVVDFQGRPKQVRQPYLDPDHCVGCGACEFACPVQDRPAVYVTSIGETRSPTNQILLSHPKPGWRT